jgi:hypothetical protein
LSLFTTADAASRPTNQAPADEPERRRYKGRHPWALLLRHVFAVDVEHCAHCKGRMTRVVTPEGVRLIELCTTAKAIERVLRHAGPDPPPHASPTRPARCSSGCRCTRAERRTTSADTLHGQAPGRQPDAEMHPQVTPPTQR